MEWKRPLSTAAAKAGRSTSEPILLGTQQDEGSSSGSNSSTAASSPSPPSLHRSQQLTPSGGIGVATITSTTTAASSEERGNMVDNNSVDTPMEIGDGGWGSVPVMMSATGSGPSVGGMRATSSISGNFSRGGSGGAGLGMSGGLLGSASNLLGGGGSPSMLLTTSQLPGVPSSVTSLAPGLLQQQQQKQEQQTRKVELKIAPTTGGSFTIVIDPNEWIQGLKQAIGKRLNVGREYINLLHRDRLLDSSKRIQDYGLVDGSLVSLVLVPSVGTSRIDSMQEMLQEMWVMLTSTESSGLPTAFGSITSTSSISNHPHLSHHSHHLYPPPQPVPENPSPRTSSQSQRASTSTSSSSTTDSTSDTLNSLSESSRNLSKTLEKLSSHVTKGDDDSFEGTLNPVLKNVSTMIEIFNGVLGGIDPGMCTQMSASTSSGSGSSSSTATATYPVSPGSSLSTDLHNKRKQPEQDSSTGCGGFSSSPCYNSPSPAEGSDTSMKRSKLAPSSTTTAAPVVSRETERENEQLRLKLERLKERLGLCKEKM